MTHALLLALLPLVTTVGPATSIAPTGGAPTRAAASQRNYVINVLDTGTESAIELSVERGATVEIELPDGPDDYVYAMIVPAGGGKGRAWSRDRAGSSTTLTDVATEIRSVVVLASKTDPKAIKYGPVITIKPKG